MATLAERWAWPSAEELAANAERMRAKYERELRAYEEKYGLPSERVDEEIAAGRLRDTWDTVRWSIMYDTYRTLIEDPAPIDGPTEPA